MTLSSNPTTSLRSPAAEPRVCRTEDCERAARPESPWCSACFGALLSAAFAPPAPRSVVRLSETDPFCVAVSAASRLGHPDSAGLGADSGDEGARTRTPNACGVRVAGDGSIHVAGGALTAGPELSLRAGGRPFAGS